MQCISSGLVAVQLSLVTIIVEVRVILFLYRLLTCDTYMNRCDTCEAGVHDEGIENPP